MKRWSSAALPIFIMLVLAALTFWLRYATDISESRGDGSRRHDPDYIVSVATVRRIDQGGALQYTLYADEIRHYPDDDTVDLVKPRLVYLNPTKPTVSISALQGHLSAKGERVDLKENVEVRREATANYPPLLVETPELTVLTDVEKAFTESPVVITQGNSWIKGVGMQVDHKLQTYLLESRVTGEIESRSAKKKPTT